MVLARISPISGSGSCLTTFRTCLCVCSGFSNTYRFPYSGALTYLRTLPFLHLITPTPPDLTLPLYIGSAGFVCRQFCLQVVLPLPIIIAVLPWLYLPYYPIRLVGSYPNLLDGSGLNLLGSTNILPLLLYLRFGPTFRLTYGILRFRATPLQPVSPLLPHTHTPTQVLFVLLRTAVMVYSPAGRRDSMWFLFWFFS